VSAGDEEEGGFLSRWSRRKRELAQQDKAPEPRIVPTPHLPAAAPEHSAAVPSAPEPEMVEPPSLDLVDKDFDVAHWLKQNVPESWKLAALRRAWEEDPAIRDYLDPARDYALDWNTPGGAPGYGPLTESDDVAEMVRKVFGDAPPEPAVVDGDQECDTLAHELSSTNENAAVSPAAHHDVGPVSAVPSMAERGSEPEERQSPDKSSGGAAGAFAAAQQNPGSDKLQARLRRRGGGATPL
jgi:hypothetical protein